MLYNSFIGGIYNYLSKIKAIEQFTENIICANLLEEDDLSR